MCGYLQTHENIGAHSGQGCCELKQKSGNSDGLFPRCSEFMPRAHVNFGKTTLATAVEGRVQEHKGEARKKSEVYWFTQEKLEPELKQKYKRHRAMNGF